METEIYLVCVLLTVWVDSFLWETW